MKRKKICAGNWKMNLLPHEAEEYFSRWWGHPQRSEPESYVFFVPAYYLALCHAQKIPNYGPENVSYERFGAFTGENSAAAARAMGARYALVGHSERRQLFHESDGEVNKKVKRVQGEGLVPMLCVGETLEERKLGKTKSVISRQLNLGLEGVDSSKPLVLAYEPVWAIGTGQVASPDQVEEIHGFIREELQGRGVESTSILYGGSVKAENARELANQKNVDGFLVGGSSLKVDEFVSIRNALFSNS